MRELTVKTNPDLVVIPDTTTPASRTAGKRLVRKHRVLNCLREKGPLSRAEISKVIGFNLPTVSSLVEELISDELAIESKARLSTMGRRPIPVSLNASAASVLGIDIGRQRSVVVVVDLNGDIIGRFEDKTPTLVESQDYIQWVINLVHSVYGQTEDEELQLPPLAGIGIAIPGLVPSHRDSSSGAISNRIADAVSAKYGIAVFVENDAQAMALGELWFGQGKDIQNFLNVNVGQGLGIGIVFDRMIKKGNMGFAGELGQIPLGEPDVKWHTGVECCLENIVSGAGLARMAKRAGMEDVDAAKLADMARNGDPQAKEIFEVFKNTFVKAVATLINLYNPQRIILSGRVMYAADLFWQDLLSELPRYTLPTVLKETDLVISRMIETSGPLGACALVLHHIFAFTHISVEEVL